MSPGSLSARWQQTKCHAPWWLCVCVCGGGNVGVTWPNEMQSLNMCVDLLMERDVNGRRH